MSQPVRAPPGEGARYLPGRACALLAQARTLLLTPQRKPPLWSFNQERMSDVPGSVPGPFKELIFVLIFNIII